MGVLNGLEPAEVFGYFEQMSAIPRGSGNIEKISDYLVDFAREQGLTYFQDEWKNVIIIKEATKGYEKEPPIIFQGHMDMVAVKTPQSLKNMKVDGLELAVEGDQLLAKETSLGGDDGIAVAYCLALLAAKNLSHPRLEVVLTVDEEVGMDGARMIDLSMLQGKRMVNLDSEEEGIFLVSCAGGVRVKARLPLPKQKEEGIAVKIKLHGLQGGHSGSEIHKERGNANILLGRVLSTLSRYCPIRLVNAQGGLADNAIPREAACCILISKDCEVIEELQKKPSEEASLAFVLKELENMLQREMTVQDPKVSITWEYDPQMCEMMCATVEDTKRATDLLISIPDGVQGMSQSVKGLVETSLNLGIMTYQEQELFLDFSVRSSVESKKEFLVAKLQSLVNLAGEML